jgi:ABC-2 type transport system ATP-binding protein
VHSIEVRDLVVRYGDLTAVDSLSFEVARGEVVALLGPNGAGKTSTAEVLEGYRRSSSGEVRVLGLDPHRQHTALTERIGVMLQGGGVYPMMGAREALRLFAAYYRSPRDADELLELVGLADVARTASKRLSGGERQRLALALAIVGRPEVAFLDEPTAGIDPSGRLLVREVIRSLRDAGTSVLLTTHELPEAEHLADRVVIIDHGRAVATGTPAELTSGAESIRFSAPPGIDVLALGQVLGEPVRETTRGEYEVAAPPAPATIASLTAWLAERDVPLGDLRAGRHRLEDVFMRLTADDASPVSGRGRRSARRR